VAVRRVEDVAIVHGTSRVRFAHRVGRTHVGNQECTALGVPARVLGKEDQQENMPVLAHRVTYNRCKQENRTWEQQHIKPGG
jgi:hypothetical protein